METHRTTFRIHAIQRMFERHISLKDVLRVLQTGETVEHHADDIPYPNSLLLGWQGRRPLHVVALENLQENETIVITVYNPDSGQWKSNFKRRKQ
jgi:hypothetical protein